MYYGNELTWAVSYPVLRNKSKEKLTVVCKNGASKAKSPCTSSCSFKTKSDILKSSCDALRKALLYLLEQVVFPDLLSEAYFWLEKCEHEARSCTCHSPQTVLATASIFAMLVLYQLLLKYTKCQYGELTVSLLFSAQREHETRPLCISIGGGAGQNEQRNHKETRIPSLQKVWPARLKQDLPLSVDLLTTSLKTTN